MMPQGYGRGGPWWAEMVLMMGNSRWCRSYVVVHGIGGLVVGSLCVGLVARVQGKGWATVMIECCVQGIGLVGAG